MRKKKKSLTKKIVVTVIIVLAILVILVAAFIFYKLFSFNARETIDAFVITGSFLSISKRSRYFNNVF